MILYESLRLEEELFENLGLIGSIVMKLQVERQWTKLLLPDFHNHVRRVRKHFGSAHEIKIRCMARHDLESIHLDIWRLNSLYK